MKGAAARREREHRELAWAAWHTAALPAAKKFPTLAEFLGDTKKPDRAARRQTTDEMIAAARMWHATMTRIQ